jgi:hypothetical protein
MATITGVTASTGSYSYYWSPVMQRRENPMARVAETLGLTTDELKSQLDTGRSLNDIATEKGIAHDVLIAAIKAGMSSETVAAGYADAIAERIAGKTHTSGDTPPPPPSGGPRGENAGLRDEVKLAEVSKLLRMDTTEVAAAATSASSLVTLLTNKGVDLRSLRDVLTSGDLLDVRA